MPSTNSIAITRTGLEELLADRSLHLSEPKQLAIIRRFEERGLGDEPPAPRPFNYTGVLLVRMRADDTNTARALLGAAAHAALEADPFIVTVEGSNVTRSPKRRAVNA